MGSCTAYPEGIPFDILSGETPHTQPLAGDNGIQWEAAEDAPDGRETELQQRDIIRE